MEVYMDDITVYGGSFKEFLINMEIVLDRCIEKNLYMPMCASALVVSSNTVYLSTDIDPRGKVH